MTTVIQNVAVPTLAYTGDILIANGRFAAFGQHLNGDTIIDGTGLTALPGFVDVHVHFREPGFTAKETIATGAAAAAHGGYTTVVAMPNVNPVPDNVADFVDITKRNAAVPIHVKQWAAITKGRTSTQSVDMAALKAAGAFGFSNDGNGVQDAATMAAAMTAAQHLNLPIAAHIEDEGLMQHGVVNAGKLAKKLNLPGIPNVAESAQLARDLELAAATNVHYHACHISTKESVALIRAAKAAGVHVTAEVTPHHLLLDETDIHADDPAFKMNPPLRSRADHLALIEGLADGTLDMIATDHAPHTAADKTGSMATAAFGIVGLETAFSLLYTQFVTTKMFTLAQLVNWLSSAPATAFGLPAGKLIVGAPADVTLVDLNRQGTIDDHTWLSKGHNSPFIGRPYTGAVVKTIASGQVAWTE
ncbi:dihydroorotase [Lacticaseibacillus nasuensis]|uniref:Dihydroorotase n=1 Tax=Lacticaseibacillus nasuensis JCM 17158 TaxID=1291734 RepID=A0A0R1JPU5_9LACO|nr:dihydroorotase [Lacticaseibacillus nasuensis]KRK73342.1 dihydroorotase [Lacticaseibacillus nasuensis JCM 17158]